MCGIIGAILLPEHDVTPLLLKGLERLAYRGYDSAGIAVIDQNQLQRTRSLGKIAALKTELKQHPISGSIGIGHTRWATHGSPSVDNAHPHFSFDDIAIVHNGIIENHEAIREQLINKGYTFSSQTDTESVVHLLHDNYKQTQDLKQAIWQTKQQLQGSFSLGIIHKDDPTHLYALAHGSPLVIGISDNAHYIASDALALSPFTEQIIYCEDGDMTIISADSLQIFDADQQPALRAITKNTAPTDDASKGDYQHFMLKEIYQQPEVSAEMLEGVLVDNQVMTPISPIMSNELIQSIEHIHLVACGTSYHAARVAQYWFEEFSNISTRVDIASEYRYRTMPIPKNTLLIALSQSGETADTLAAVKKAKQQPYLTTLGVSNVAHSNLMRQCDYRLLTRAGSEIGVAATKTFTAQLVALACFSLQCGQQKNTACDAHLQKTLINLPELIKATLQLEDDIKKVATELENAHSCLFLGRGTLYAIAQEGALKLKEISYIHSQAYAAGELKHGPLALIDDGFPVIVSLGNDHVTQKTLSNIEEVCSRGGDVIVFADESIAPSSNKHTHIIKVPNSSALCAPILHGITLQLLAYHVALLRGTDVDQPRNLAKSVTVE